MAHKTWKNLVRILTLTCDQAARLMSHAQDRPLERPERWALSFHLLICRLCRKYNRERPANPFHPCGDFGIRFARRAVGRR